MVVWNSLDMPRRHHLMALIQLQTKVAKLGIPIDKVLGLVTDRSMTLTSANTSVIELAEDDFIVYRSADGLTNTS